VLFVFQYLILTIECFDLVIHTSVVVYVFRISVLCLSFKVVVKITKAKRRQSNQESLATFKRKLKTELFKQFC